MTWRTKVPVLLGADPWNLTWGGEVWPVGCMDWQAEGGHSSLAECHLHSLGHSCVPVAAALMGESVLSPPGLWGPVLLAPVASAVWPRWHFRSSHLLWIPTRFPTQLRGAPLS